MLPLVDAPQSGLATARLLSRNQAQPLCEVPALPERSAVAYRGDDGGSNNRADAAGYAGGHNKLRHWWRSVRDYRLGHRSAVRWSSTRPSNANQVAHHWRQRVACVFENLGPLSLQLRRLGANIMPRSSRKARIWFITIVRRGTSRSRIRCIACRSSWSSVLIGTKRIFLRSTASAMASASTKSFLLDFTNGSTNRAGTNRTSWPCCLKAHPRKCAPEQASRPINEACLFAVNARSCFCENFFFGGQSPSQLPNPNPHPSTMPDCASVIISSKLSFTFETGLFWRSANTSSTMVTLNGSYLRRGSAR